MGEKIERERESVREEKGEDRGRENGIHKIITQKKDTKLLLSILLHKSEQLIKILRI